MAVITSLNTAVFYCCDRCNRLIPPLKTTAIKTQIMEDDRYRFSWQNRSVIWEKEYGSFRVSFNLDNTVEVLKEANVPRKHMCHSFRPKYINEILQSIRELDEDCLRGLCKKGLDIHAFRDPQGRSLFHLIAAECFDAPPANQLKRQGKINLLIYLCVDIDT